MQDRKLEAGRMNRFRGSGPKALGVGGESERETETGRGREWEREGAEGGICM